MGVGSSLRVQKIRPEPFGAVIGTEDPVTLFWVDHEYLRTRGFNGSGFNGEVLPSERLPVRARGVGPGPGPGSGPGAPVWRQTTRPVEAEIAVTTRCNLACPCCYQDAGPGGDDVPYQDLRARLEAVATLGVFHVAFGGGEPLLHPALFELAEHARQLNMIPSLSTNGYLVTPTWASTATGIFGRVNVSVDWPGGARCGGTGEPAASCGAGLWALEVLAEAGVGTGMAVGANFIVTKGNLGVLPQVFRRCREAGADSVLILRPKPGGRGSLLYPRLGLSRTEAEALVPMLLELSHQYQLPFHLDCALGPLLMRAAPSREPLALWGASGCIAGTLLVTVDAEGYVRPCSHLDAQVCHFSELPRGWEESGQVSQMRLRHGLMTGSCGACDLAAMCGGGCAAVNQYFGLPLTDPDPDLPCSLRGSPVDCQRCCP